MSASAAGLTAAAVQDSAADGRWTLEAGALALADLGLAAIDEFDKMNENDRSSMHEAMEQQRISVSKAGINATLSQVCYSSRCKPESGRFQAVSEVPFTQQINLKPALISRFDVIWLLTDQPVADHDSLIANHIMNNRADSTPEILIEQGSEIDPAKSARHEGVDDKEGIVNRELIRKYVAFAKDQFIPDLQMKQGKHSENSMLKLVGRVENQRIQFQSRQEQLKAFTDLLRRLLG